MLRVAALFLDYILLIAVPVFDLVITQLVATGPARGAALGGAITWLLTLLVALSNIIILPALSGQSLGKLLTGLRIVNIDGTAAPAAGILVRHVVGYLLTFLSLGLGFLLAAFTKNGRALHDYVSGTVVVRARRRNLQ
jgi:uncharacterized RDD family membrane protein YckC